MRALVFVMLIIGFIGIASAIHVTSPVDQEVADGGTVYIGKIGPGQTISVLIESEVKTGGTFNTGGFYDQAVFEKVPMGWCGEKSKLYDKPLRVALTADPQAAEGAYTAKINIIDENKADGLETKSIYAKLDVIYDVMDASVQPAAIKTGPGQPARFDIVIENKGATGDAFEVSAIGAKKWSFKRQVFVPARSSKTVSYEIVGNEEETYVSSISVTSLASPLIHEEKNVTVTIQSDILGDMKATNNGVILFPIFESLVYSFFGLISNLY